MTPSARILLGAIIKKFQGANLYWRTGSTHNGFSRRNVRAYKDQDEVVKKLIENGIPEAIIYERKVLGITAMEKAITKKVFSSLLADLIVKPQGKPALVDESDKRPEWNGTASAVNDFSE